MTAAAELALRGTREGWRGYIGRKEAKREGGREGREK